MFYTNIIGHELYYFEIIIILNEINKKKIIQILYYIMIYDYINISLTFVPTN